MVNYPKLFEPIKIGNMEVRNRTVMGAMGTGFGDPETNYPTETMAKYYEERARGGTGLIVVEQTVVEKRGIWSPNGAGIWSDEFIPHWKNIVENVQAHGAKIVLQVGHLGRSTNSQINGGQRPIAPSAVPCHLMQETPEEMTLEDIENFKQQYLEGVERAKEAGFDGVEIHCTHGYLLAAFLSGRSNKRTDKYGGTLENRLRLPLEIIQMVREKVGRDFPLLLRLASHEENGGRTLEETKVLAKAFEEAGIDALDVSAGSFSELDWEIPPYYFGPACNVENIEQIKEVVDIPVIASGRITEPRMAEQIVKNGRSDMVGINRTVIADPYWAKKAGAGREDKIRRCIGCTRCIDELFATKEMALKCSVNPWVGKEGELPHEDELPLVNESDRKNILVVGGGPSGLQAAVTSEKRGHTVTLMEKEKQLGGQIRAAAVPPKKYEITSVISWLANEANELGVDIKTNTEATSELIESCEFDEIIVATGAKPCFPDIPGIKGNNVVNAVDVLNGDANVGSKIVIVGGGMIGCETAEFIAEYGRDVTVLEMEADYAADVGVVIRDWLINRLNKLGVKVNVNSKLTAINESTVEYSSPDGTVSIDDVDTVIIAMGMEENRSLDIKESDKVHTIGDASNVCKLLEALQAGLETGLKL